MSLSNFEVIPGIRVGHGEPLLLLAGPCVAESLEVCSQVAAEAKAVCADLGVNYVFKASFDKANRTSIKGFRGPGMKAGLELLAAVKQKYQVPIVTDVHEPPQCAPVAEVADILQIPAFLCRQTDLLLAAAKTARPVNVKKGQFLAPEDMAAVVKKLESTGNERILLTDRGTTFGYHNLVVDMRGLAIMRGLGCPSSSTRRIPCSCPAATGPAPAAIGNLSPRWPGRRRRWGSMRFSWRFIRIRPRRCPMAPIPWP